MGFDKPSVQEELRGFGRCYVEEAEGGGERVWGALGERGLFMHPSRARAIFFFDCRAVDTHLDDLEDEWTVASPS